MKSVRVPVRHTQSHNTVAGAPRPRFRGAAAIVWNAGANTELLAAPCRFRNGWENV
jgi:hypothetical protein